MFNSLRHMKKGNRDKEYQIKNQKYAEIQRFMKNNEYEKALDLLFDFIIDYPNDYVAKYDRAICLLKMNYEDVAIEELNILRKKNTKKKIYNIYTVLIDYYMKNSEYEKVEPLLDDGKKVLSYFEYNILRTKYYYNIGRCSDAEAILETLNTKTEEEAAKLYVFKLLFYNNDYLRKNKKDIEIKLQQFLKKTYITEDTAKKAYLKLYTACSDDEKSYEYISTDLSKGVKSLIKSYNICMRLGKYFEAQKYLEMINSYELPENAKLAKVDIMYINGQKEEAFELCKKYALDDLDAAISLYDYSIKLNRMEEAVEIIRGLIDKKAVISKKTVNVMERLVGLYIHLQRYEEAYNFVKENEVYFVEFKLEEYYTYLSKKLNIWHSPNPNFNSYVLRQLRSYSFDAAIGHIAKHKYEDKTKAMHTVFNDDIQIISLIDIIRPYLTEENLYEVGTVDKYEIDCKDLEINEKRLVVGKISNEDDIVFCFPSKSSELEYNYDDDEEIYETKTKSRILKFKERYHLN